MNSFARLYQTLFASTRLHDDQIRAELDVALAQNSAANSRQSRLAKRITSTVGEALDILKETPHHEKNLVSKRR